MIIFIHVIDVTANETLLGDLYDDVYHAHKVNDNLHITLKHFFMTSYCFCVFIMSFNFHSKRKINICTFGFGIHT